MCTVSRFLFCGVQNVRVLRADVRTGRPVSNLQLVSVEYLPSIEGALEIQMNVTFLRGKAPLPGADSPYQGEMSRRDKRGRDAVSRRLTERLYQICIEKPKPQI